MRNIFLIPAVLVVLSLFTVGATLTFPRIQVIEFEEIVIESGSRKQLCAKYHELFMVVLHESLVCSEDIAIEPKDEERCAKVLALLDDYSRLRSQYCYEEDWDEI